LKKRKGQEMSEREETQFDPEIQNGETDLEFFSERKIYSAEEDVQNETGDS
jgi:hypothetical protein